MMIPKIGLRQKCYEIAKERSFEIVNAICMLIMLVMYGAKYYMMPQVQFWIFRSITYICVIELNIYCLIKFMGFGVTYLQDSWNLLDLSTLALLDFGIIFELSELTPVIFALGVAAQLISTIKYLQYIKNTKIRVIVDSLLFILPSLLNVSILVLIILVIYATLGMHLFWNVNYQGSINENMNFRSFGNALLLVLSCATGEDWNGIMQSLANVQGECDDSQTFEDIKINGIHGCGTAWAYPYFITFVMIVNLVIMKLFMVVAIEGYMEAVNEHYSIITSKSFEEFLDNWSTYDPQGTGWISFEGLVYLFFSLDPPLGVYDEKVRERLWTSYKKRTKTASIRSRLVKSLISQVDLNEDFILHQNDNSVFEKHKVLKLLRELDLPLEVGTWRAHYRDVCQQMTLRAIANKRKTSFQYF